MHDQLRAFATEDAKISWRKIVRHGYRPSPVVKPLKTNLFRQTRRPLLLSVIGLTLAIVVHTQWLNIVHRGWKERHNEVWGIIDAITSSVTIFAIIGLILITGYVAAALSLRSTSHQAAPWRKGIPRPVTYAIRVRSTLNGDVEATVERKAPRATGTGLAYSNSTPATFVLGSSDDAVAVIDEYATILDQCTTLGEQARERWLRDMQTFHIQEDALKKYHQQYPVRSLIITHHDQLGNHLKAYAQTREVTAA